MVGGNLYNYINVLDKVADASSTRLECINNNIADVSTPDYKRKDVEFESYLSQALSSGESMGETVAGMELGSLDANIYTDNAELSYRTDGNNVDISTETTYQAETQIKYNAVLSCVTNEFSMIRAVLNK